MKSKHYVLLAAAAMMSINVAAQRFEDYFQDKTLRIDYIFSGTATTQHIALEQMYVEPRWYGKRQRLAEVPVEGNGQITVRDHKTKRVIYRNSFSTEARHLEKSFENVYLVPMPKDTVDITVDLRNNRRQVSSHLTHTVAPTDILIAHLGEKNVTPYIVLQQAQDTTHCIHLAYLAEGYRPEEMKTFVDDARMSMGTLFSYEPFKSNRRYFNVVAVKSPSEESGASEPGKGIWKNTALHAHWDTNYSESRICTTGLQAPPMNISSRSSIPHAMVVADFIMVICSPPSITNMLSQSSYMSSGTASPGLPTSMLTTMRL